MGSLLTTPAFPSDEILDSILIPRVGADRATGIIPAPASPPPPPSSAVEGVLSRGYDVSGALPRYPGDNLLPANVAGPTQGGGGDFRITPGGGGGPREGYLGSAHGTNAEAAGDFNYGQLKLARAHQEQELLASQLAADKLRQADDEVNDPMNAEIDAQKKAAALEELLPVGPGAAPSSHIGAEYTDPVTGQKRRVSTGEQEIRMRGQGARAIELSPGFQMRGIQRGLDTIQNAISYNERIAATGKKLDPQTGTEVPASPEEIKSAHENAGLYRELYERKKKEAELMLPAYTGKALYHQPAFEIPDTGAGATPPATK